MTPSFVDRALNIARIELDGCGFPAFTAIALTDDGPALPPFSQIALRPAVASAGQLRGDHPAADIVVVGCDRRGQETLWTVYDEHGERRLLTRREVPEERITTLLDIL